MTQWRSPASIRRASASFPWLHHLPRSPQATYPPSVVFAQGREQDRADRHVDAREHDIGNGRRVEAPHVALEAFYLGDAGNVADSAICIGVGLLFILSWQNGTVAETKPANEPSGANL